MNSAEFLNNIHSERCNADEFMKLSLEFCEVLHNLGIEKKPFRNSQKLFFSKRSLKDQKKVIAYLDININILKECIASGESAFSNKVLIWRALGKIGATPQDDIFDKITDDDLVEVYFPDHTPIFRNLKFYREFSYTVDEALCLTWYQFCKREIVVTFKIMRFTLKYIKRNARETLRWPIPIHYVDEKNTEKEYRATMEHKYISGAHQKGELAALICTSSIKIVGERGKLW